MNYIILIYWLLLIGPLAIAQEKELEDFTHEIDFYIDFTVSKSPSLPVNEANQNKFRKKVDDAFIQFILHKNSNQCSKFISSANNPDFKFIRASKKCEITLKTFTTDQKSYSVFSYTSMNKINYFIKDDSTNTIVYDGNSKVSTVDSILAIDGSHIIVIEEIGDYHYGRAVTVLSTLQTPWKPLKAFEGKAFGQVPMEYFTSKYVKRRAQFIFSCNDFPPSYFPKNFNQISFNTSTKTLSYTIYPERNVPKIVSAKWENEHFILDDYSVKNINSDVEDIGPR